MSQMDRGAALAANFAGVIGDSLDGRTGRTTFGPSQYLAAVIAIALALLAALAFANRALNPYLYSPDYKVRVVDAFMSGQNYALHDLNFDMRALRREHIARMQVTPDLIVLGASHWQEADASLAPNMRFYNAHVHRDYVEDLLALTELLVRHDRLPKTLVMSVRDLTFSPPSTRSDWWWLFAVPEYRAMAKRLGIVPHGWTEIIDLSWVRELLMFKPLWTQLERAWRQPDPGATAESSLDEMDLLMPDGSIRWSRQHQSLFTRDFVRADVVRTATQRRAERLPIDARAVEALDRLLEFLVSKGVRVVLAHPPYHPELYALLDDTPFRAALPAVVALTRKLASKHGLEVVGSFDAAEVGCTEEMFIDREHANAACLKRILNQVRGKVPSFLQPRALGWNLRGSL
jgi:hypothetical protein